MKFVVKYEPFMGVSENGRNLEAWVVEADGEHSLLDLINAAIVMLKTAAAEAREELPDMDTDLTISNLVHLSACDDWRLIEHDHQG